MPAFTATIASTRSEATIISNELVHGEVFAASIFSFYFPAFFTGKRGANLVHLVRRPFAA
jgi:hypothetical protein